MNDHAVIVAAAAGSATVATLSAFSKGDAPSPRTYIGIGFAFALIGLGAEVAPEVALPMALLVFLSILLNNGLPFLSALSNLFGPSPVQNKSNSMPQRGK